MRRIFSSLLVVSMGLTVGSISWGAAAESRCDSNLVVFSRNSQNIVGSVNWNGVICIPGNFVHPAFKSLGDQAADFRLINPNSDIIQVRYAEDDVPGTPASIRARVNGLGLKNKMILLSRVDVDLTGEDPSWVYDGGDLSIDPNAQGCLEVDAWHSIKKKVKTGHKKHARVRTRLVKVFSATTTYHTFDTVAC